MIGFRRLLFDLMRADHRDSKSIETTIAEINGVQEDMQKMVVAHMLEFKSLLDKDQQKKFFDYDPGGDDEEAGDPVPLRL